MTQSAAQLGVSHQLLSLQDAAACTALASDLVRQARREVLLHTYDLDPRIYDNTLFLEAMTHFLLQHPRAQGRVLLQDSSGIIKNGHRLIELGRRLSSRLELRKTSPDYPFDPQTFLVVDACGYLHRALASRYEASGDYHDPMRAQALARLHLQHWEQAQPDGELRRLHL